MEPSVSLVTTKPDYPRNSVLIRACHEAVRAQIFDLQAKHASQFELFKNLKRSKTIIFIWPALSFMPLLLTLRLFTRSRIIYDAFTSYYDSAVNDRKVWSKFHVRALLTWAAELLTVHLCHELWLDTQGHLDYFRRAYGVNAQKTRIIPVSIDINRLDSYCTKKTKPVNQPATVLFYGSYIPLQGTDVIIKAAARLTDIPVKFLMVGNGQTYDQTRKLARDLNASNIIFQEGLPYPELIRLIESADISLGIFGTTSKAQRVIPNKVIEALACGKCLITARNPELERHLKHKESVLFCEPGDHQGLASCLLTALADPDLRDRLGKNARLVAERDFGYNRLVAQMREILCNSPANNTSQV